MNKIFIPLLSLALCFLATSCDENFDELNTSKTGSTTLDPAIVLNFATISSSPGGTTPGTATSTLTYDIVIVQQMTTSNSGVLVGGNFNQINIGNTPLTWQNYYQNVIKYTADIINRTKDDGARTNLYNMARIVQANAFMVLTDTYGDIPYSEAGGGYFNQNFFPAYESQESIYPQIISELSSATAALDPALAIEPSDVLFGGNIAKWKKFGYSLLLRAGMHLSKVNPTLAAQTVNTAFNGGVILSNDDNAVINHDANYVNGIGNIVNGTEAANFYMAEPFVKALQSTNDPRLKSIAVRYVGATSGAGQTATAATTDPANQYGMPMGLDDGTAQTAAENLGIGSRYAFTQVDRARILKRTSPAFIVTAAQCNLLLAEAVERGWITGGLSASEYFTAGVKAHMDQMVKFDALSAVAEADRDTYLANNPLDQTSVDTALADIGYQYWIASFLIGNEAWANFRRTGYPALAPNPFPGKSVEWIHRVTYPPSELAVNTSNVQSAAEAMGGDKLDTRVWWDVE